MTALILVVDDLEPNVKLLEAKLTNEYYDVITASNGFEAIEQAKEHSPDIILLDVMMPEMDGFEACQKLKADPLTSHIPVVMVTALSEPSDRIRGLECGADDFITKPIKEIQLMARVKSLVRIKMLIDELRLRGQTSAEIGDLTGEDMESLMSISGCNVVVVDDDAIQGKNITERLNQEGLTTKLITDPDQTIEYAQANPTDLFVVSTQLGSMDGLRLCSQLRSMDETRHVPELIIVEEDDERRLVKGLEMGVNDYLITPVDVNELMCRVRTNIRRKKYKDALKANYKQSVNMAITDGLTGVYNRHYLTVHLEKQLKTAIEKQKPLSFMIIDADHFKQVNDNYGHDVGDEVLKELANRMVNQTRGSDMVARFGGEEFVMLMPGLGMPTAVDVSERLRASVELIPFRVSHDVEQLDITVSVGVSTARPGDTAETILKRADNALYEAKHGGRNRVVIAEDDAVVSMAMQQDNLEHAPIESDERTTEAAEPIVDVQALEREERQLEQDAERAPDNESHSIEDNAEMAALSEPEAMPPASDPFSSPEKTKQPVVESEVANAAPLPPAPVESASVPVVEEKADIPNEQPVVPAAPAAVEEGDNISADQQPSPIQAEQPAHNPVATAADVPVEPHAEPSALEPVAPKEAEPATPATATPPAPPVVDPAAAPNTVEAAPPPVVEPVAPAEPPAQNKIAPEANKESVAEAPEQPKVEPKTSISPAASRKAEPDNKELKQASLFGALTSMLKPKKKKELPVKEEKTDATEATPQSTANISDSGRPPPENAKVVQVKSMDPEDVPVVPGLELKKEATHSAPPPSLPPIDPMATVTMQPEPPAAPASEQQQPAMPTTREHAPVPPQAQQPAPPAPPSGNAEAAPAPASPQPAATIPMEPAASVDHLSLGTPGKIIQDDDEEGSVSSSSQS